MRNRPVGITMGCPAGIGPEIIVRAFAQNQEWARERTCVVIGSRTRLSEAAAILGMDASFTNWSKETGFSEKEGPGGKVTIPVHDIQAEADEGLPWGKPDAITGAASMKYLTRAIDLAMEGAIHAIVTAPLSKHGLKMAGIDFPGHTEILADRTGAKRYAMMLAGERLRVVLVTIHCPLRDVAGLLSLSAIMDTITITHDSLKEQFGISCPEIAVAGLNPHAGENGMFGNEESEIIAPAVRKAASRGIHVSGPWPPDTLFYNAVKGSADAVVCMYHDQGLIPFKLLHFSDGVNITLGLPIIRTSVDHGTAYDIAGMGVASPDSLIQAVRAALSMAIRRGTS